MSDSFDTVINKVQLAMQEGKDEFVIYPFGERGAMVKGIINQVLGVNELAVADNLLCIKYSNVLGVKDLTHLLKNHSKAVVLVAHDNISSYAEVRERLYEYVPKDRCIELFDCPQDPYRDIARHESEAIAKKERIGFDDELAIYQPAHTNSVFYLPFYQIDAIQNEIFLADDYMSREQLSYVFEQFQGGIIGQNAEGKLFLDIGANIGNHTLFFANELKGKSIHSFEPVTQTFRILKKNIELNHLEDKVCLHKCGLGNESFNASVLGSYDMRNIGGAGLRMDSNGDIQIKRLDDFLFEDKVYFIKIDVEGMEFLVLQGAEETLKKNRPYVLLEAWNEEKIKPIRAFMGNLGYAVTAVNEMDYLFYYS